METAWSDLTAHAPAGPLRDALAWVAETLETPDALRPGRVQERLHDIWLSGSQAVRYLEVMRRLPTPFRVLGVETPGTRTILLRCLSADDLHLRLLCELSAADPRSIVRLRLDWIGPEEIPLTDWEQVPDLIAHYRVPSLSVAWADATGEPVARAWGAGPETRFPACSITKALTAVVALILVQRGVLRLDEDVDERLTSWRVPANGSWQPRLTLRTLLSHSAGLTVYSYFGIGPGDPDRSLLDLLEGRDPDYRPVRVELLPGLLSVYSNAGYAIVQQLVEDATGADYARLTHELVLEPLGMASSVLAQSPPPALREHMATGHDQFGAPLPWQAVPCLTMTGLITTAADLCRLARGIQRAVAGAPGAILSAELAHETMRPVIEPCIGLGVTLSTSGRRRFAHRGGFPGWATALTATVEPGPAIAVMTNRDGGSPLLWAAMTLGSYEVAGDELFVTQKPLTEATMEASRIAPRPPGRPPGAPLHLPAGRAGMYRVRDGYRLNVAVGPDGPTVEVPGQGPIPLVPDGDGTFALEGLATTLRFEGEDAAVLRQGPRTWKAVRT